MFASAFHRRDFADTCASPELAPQRPAAVPPAPQLAGTEWQDALEQFAQSDKADRSLLGLVVCTAITTLLLAVVGSLV